MQYTKIMKRIILSAVCLCICVACRQNQKQDDKEVDHATQTSSRRAEHQSHSAKNSEENFAQVDITRLQQLFEKALQTSDNETIDLILTAIIEKDFDLGMRLFQELDQEQMGLHSSFVLGNAYAKAPEATLQWLDDVGIYHPAQSTILRCFIGTLAQEHPREGLEILLSKRYPFDPIAINRFYMISAMLHHSFLIDRFASLPSEHKGMVTSALAKAMMKESPMDALTFLRQHPRNDAAFNNTVGEVYAQLAIRDWESFLSTFAQEKPALQIAALSTGNLLDQIAKKDPAQVQGIIENIPLTTATQGVYWKTAQALAKNHPDQATAWLNQLADVPAKTEIARIMFRTMLFEHEATTAMAQVELLSGSAQQAARRSVVAELAKSDFDQALTIAKSVSETQQQDVFREIARSSAFENPQNAISMINDTTLSEKLGEQFRNEMINHTVQNWAKQDREAAQQWVEKLPPADQPKGIQGLVASWMKTDPIAASDWLSKQAAGPARDAGAQEIINQIKDTDPEMAEQWRKSMTPKTE
jgi:hypothetical protein